MPILNRTNKKHVIMKWTTYYSVFFDKDNSMQNTHFQL